MKEKKPQCTYEGHPSVPGKVWHFLWHEDTWASFVVDALLIILIGKFILYPLIGLALGTSFPLVAVVSDSMDHRGATFDQWWEANQQKYEPINITKSDFEAFRLEDGFSRGDLVLVVGKDSYDPGDVIVYSVKERAYPIIHRVVKAESGVYDTYGDANVGQLAFEKSIATDKIHGEAVLCVPHLGWVKVLFVNTFNFV